MDGRHGEGHVVPLTPEEEAVWRALACAVVVIPRVLDADLKQSDGLTLTEYMVLMNLSEAPEYSLRMSELASVVAISVSGLTRVIERLERDDLVERVRSSTDGRCQFACLRPAGLERLKRAWPAHLDSVRRHVMDHFRGVDLAGLADALSAVARAEDPPAHRRRH